MPFTALKHLQWPLGASDGSSKEGSAAYGIYADRKKSICIGLRPKQAAGEACSSPAPSESAGPTKNGKGGIGRSSPPVRSLAWHRPGHPGDSRPVRFLSFSSHGCPGFFCVDEREGFSGLDCDLHRHDVDDGRYRFGVPVHRSSPVESMMHRYRDDTILVI